MLCNLCVSVPLWLDNHRDTETQRPNLKEV
jgi:hypothetical protein